MKKRPVSSKNISRVNSPKVQTAKQIPHTYEENSYQESRPKKSDEITEEEQ
jgi:hypothetical protein